MRKLKLQMQTTVDGFVAGPEGQLDWMTFDMDDKLLAFITHLTDTSDTSLMGRKMTDGFVMSSTAMETRLRWPPESWAMGTSRRSESPVTSITSRTI